MMRLAVPALALSFVVSTAVTGSSASAGPALDDDKTKATPPASVEIGCKTANDARCHEAGDEDEVEYGVGLRLRSVWVPRAILELFIERAKGAQNIGYGVDLTRRRGTTELQLGFEYEHIKVGEGVWIASNNDVAVGDEADYVLDPKHSGHQLSWFTVEFTFLNHAEINKMFSVRYGGGLGLGIIIGELDHYNIVCRGATNATPEPGCVPMRFGGTGEYSADPGGETQVAYNLPAVFPVVNAILGLEIKPTNKLTINIEGGIRTLPFVGVSSSYFF